VRITPIQSLKRNVNRQEALRTFSSPGFSALYWRMKSGPLRRIADVYVPYAIYRVRYQMGKAAHVRNFALDAVNGSLDPFEFRAVPGESELETVETRNHLNPSLSEASAQELLHDKVLRLIFQQGFFKLRDPQLEIRCQQNNIYVPYWLGFYGQLTARCRVLNAVRRRIEGAKASAFFEQWLAA
jgi:hypothetical protein